MSNSSRQEGRSAEPKITFQELKNHFESLVAPGLTIQEQRNFRSALTQFQKYLRRAESDLVGPELIENSEAALADYLGYRKDDRNSSTPSNLKRLLRKWAKWAAEIRMKETRADVTTFSAAFVHYYYKLKETSPKLSLRGLAKQTSIPVPTIFTWFYRGTKQCKPSTLSELQRLEKVLDAPEGALTAFITPPNTRSERARSKIGTGAWGKRIGPLLSSPYRAKRNQISARLKAEWLGLLDHKTSSRVRRMKRNEIWRLRPMEECDEADWKREYATIDGQFAPTALMYFNVLRTFLGSLLQLQAANGKPGYLPDQLSLAWLVDFERLDECIEFLRKRLGTTATTEKVLILANSLIHPEFGYLRQKPEFGARLVKPVDIKDWPQWCDSQRSEIKEELKEIGKILKHGKHRKKTRNPFAPIMQYIVAQHPREVLFVLADSMSRHLANHPLMPEYMRRTLERDLLFVEMITFQPLRLKMWEIMTYKPDDLTSNLYQRPSGLWAIRFEAEAFKNEEGALQSRYDVEFGSEVSGKISKYINDVRPYFLKSRKLDRVSELSDREKLLRDRVFIPQDNGYELKNAKRTAYLEIAFNKRTREFLDDCYGFGPHCARHLVATEIIKNSEGGFALASQVLHDTIETVRDAYTRISPQDGFRVFGRYDEEQRREFRERENQVAGKKEVSPADKRNALIKSLASDLGMNIEELQRRIGSSA